MNRRRFMILAVSLVALNTFFWVAQGGFAIGGGLIQNFFGSRMVRAEVVYLNPDGTTGDERIDRGVITAVTPALIILREADGTTAAIAIAPTAQVQGGRINSVSRLRRGLRVLVSHPANAPADSVVVEGVGG